MMISDADDKSDDDKESCIPLPHVSVGCGRWLETHGDDNDDQVVMVIMMMMTRWRKRPPLPPHRPGRGALTQSPTNREQTRSTNTNLFLLEILLLIFS